MANSCQNPSGLESHLIKKYNQVGIKAPSHITIDTIIFAATVVLAKF
jgi:hypothetical protein